MGGLMRQKFLRRTGRNVAGWLTIVLRRSAKAASPRRARGPTCIPEYHAKIHKQSQLCEMALLGSRTRCVWVSACGTSGAMEIQLNGEAHLAPEDATLQTLLESIGIDTSRIAVELDGVIIRRGDWPHTQIHGGSKVEVVQFVGGGR